jgi:hypothetical protein
LNYEKPGKYGDAKQEKFRVQVSDFHRKPKGEKIALEGVKNLAKGDYVCLSYRHDYVTRKGSKFPERPLTKLEKITPAQAKKLME